MFFINPVLTCLGSWQLYSKTYFHIDVNDVHRQDIQQRSFQNFPTNKNLFMSLKNVSLILKVVSTFENICKGDRPCSSFHTGSCLLFWAACRLAAL